MRYTYQMRAVIVDDEMRGIESLQWELKNFAPHVEVLSVFQNPLKAKQFLKSNSVDLLFLDVEMPAMNGIDFLRFYGKKNFEVIYTTAYAKFAFDALKNEVVDYLLKPVDTEDLKKALDKAKRRIENKKLVEKLKDELEKAKEPKKARIDKLKVYFDGEICFLDFNEVVCLKSDGNYCQILLVNGEKKLITQSLKGLLKDLPKQRFFRTHKSYAINVEKVVAYNKKDNIITLDNKEEVPLARNRKREFSELFL